MQVKNPARRVASVAVLVVAVLGACPASGAAPRRHGHPPPARQAATPPAAALSEPDDLYRRRGYGSGGALFGLGQGGTSMAGTCAELRFATGHSCGKGYGVYGNGLGYGFGF